MHLRHFPKWTIVNQSPTGSLCLLLLFTMYQIQILAGNVKLFYWFQSWRYFHPYESQIRKFFTLGPDYVAQSQNVLHQIAAKVQKQKLVSGNEND